jgi:hypothetical protein
MAENEYIPEQESIIEDAFESVSKRAKENTKKEKISEEQRFLSKSKKQKRQEIEELRQEEIWEDWEDGDYR